MSTAKKNGKDTKQHSAGNTVIVAHHFRLLRELTAYALRVLRPEARVLMIDPSGLAALCRQTSPVLVICDEPEEINESSCDVWIRIDQLQPGLGTIRIRDRICREVATDLDTVVRVFDTSVRLRNDT